MQRISRRICCKRWKLRCFLKKVNFPAHRIVLLFSFARLYGWFHSRTINTVSYFRFWSFVIRIPEEKRVSIFKISPKIGYKHPRCECTSYWKKNDLCHPTPPIPIKQPICDYIHNPICFRYFVTFLILLTAVRRNPHVRGRHYPLRRCILTNLLFCWTTFFRNCRTGAAATV